MTGVQLLESSTATFASIKFVSPHAKLDAIPTDDFRPFNHELLLSTFVHEQLHWYLGERPKETEAAYKELKSIFPKVPVGFPEGARDEESTYKHILVCYLEYQAVRGLLGELKSRQVMEFWATDHYTWIYRTVLEREREIGSLMRKHKLLPVQRANQSFNRSAG
ncbi:MAG: hypothetical protein LC731_06665 [Acidobacteria bacterium]|nr:hypothetical protein [Acidobacteriota bacterium]